MVILNCKLSWRMKFVLTALCSRTVDIQFQIRQIVCIFVDDGDDSDDDDDDDSGRGWDGKEVSEFGVKWQTRLIDGKRTNQN